MSGNSYKGSILGGLIGLFFGGPVTGLVGAGIGYFLVDKPTELKRKNDEKAQKAFTQDANYNIALVDITFSLAGYIARGAGRINEEHIKLANQIMDVMQLSENSRQVARHSFNKGKSDDFDILSKVSELKRLIGTNTSMIEYLLEIEIQVALSDMTLEEDEIRRLIYLGQLLEVSADHMRRLINSRYSQMILERVRNGDYEAYKRTGGFGGYRYSNQDYGNNQKDSSDNSYNSYQSAGTDKLKAAYDLLEVSESDSDETIKRAHKKLMLKYHPDRLASQGLTPEMIRLYTEKAKDIQAAFDLIKKERHL
ncbi:MAG: co-chaperone DjlA [Aeromonadales bacterium]|nr:co-chaperone DjlA [Aeromonadales bacterium]